MTCSRCGQENVARARFCTRCGHELGSACPQCGFDNPPEARFCGGCGLALHPSRAAEDLPGERRQLTVLFCDLVESTRLSQQLDPEDLLAVTAAYQELCGEAAAAHHGYIGQYLGDGIILYFGYPQAREDDAERAVRCGLDLVQRVADLGGTVGLGLSLAARVGIHTGRVVVGPIRPGDRKEWIAHGDATNIAARLQAEADPGTVVASETTWSLVQGHFDGRSLGPLRLRGVAQPMTAWCVECESEPREHFDAASVLSPFVGREREREILDEAWAAALQGDTRFLLLRGDPGVGKSRLARLSREQAREAGARVLLARATPDSRNQPFHPVVVLLEQTFGLDRASPDEERLDRLEAALREQQVDGAETIPLLAPLLGIRPGPRYAPPDLSPARRRARTLDTVTRLFAALARREPTLLVFEDLHWADSSTTDLMEQVVATLSGLPLLGLFAARPELDPEWGSGTRLQLLDLGGLGRADAEAIVRNVVGGKALPGDVLRQILRWSEGVPLFAEEVTRSVLESGVLRERAASWEAVAPLPDEPLIPMAVHSSLAARIDRLGSSRPTAQLAATIGREFSFALLREVSDRDEATLRADIRRLMEAGLAWESGETGPDTFMFKHALVRDAAYESLLRSTRQEYHRRIAAALRGSLSSLADGRPDLIASHLSDAGQYEEAVGFWEKAGEDALERGAMPEAAGDFRRAVGCLAKLPATPERKAREMELQLRLAPVLMAVHGWASQEVEQACERARSLAEELGRPDRIYPSLWGLWSVYFLRGELTRALSEAEVVHGMAEASGVPLLQVTGRHAAAYTRVFRGELEQALALAESGLALFDPAQERAIVSAFQFSSSIALLQSKAQALWMLGRVEEADAAARRMLQLGRELDHPFSLASALAFALHGGGIRYSYPREMVRLRDIADELRKLSQEEGFELWFTVAETYRGVIALALGEEGARARMLGGRELFLQTRTRITLVMMDVMIAEALLDLGDHEEARRLLDEAEAEMQAREERLDAPEIWRVRGRLLARQGDPARAEAALLHSLDFADRQKAHSLALRAALDLYDLLAARGRAEEGRTRLAAVFDRVPWADRPEPARALQILRAPA